MKFTTLLAAATLSNVVFAAPIAQGGSTGLENLKVNTAKGGDPWDATPRLRLDQGTPEFRSAVRTNVVSGVLDKPPVINPAHNVETQNAGVKAHDMAKTATKVVPWAVGAAGAFAGLRKGSTAPIQKIKIVVQPKRLGAVSRPLRVTPGTAGSGTATKMAKMPKGPR